MKIFLLSSLACLLIVGAFSYERLGQLFSESDEKEEVEVQLERVEEKEETTSTGITFSEIEELIEEEPYPYGDSIYVWEGGYFYTIDKEVSKTYRKEASKPKVLSSDPIEINWQDLLNIEYELRYFADHDMEAYAPLFTEKVEAYHEQEVIIEGFIIPIDETENLMALSMNPFASCFFCGNASPASVISLYLKKDSKRYKTDDYKRFKGTMYLNEDDLRDFYYILRDAEEVK